MQARNTTQVASYPTFTGKRQISKRGQPLWRGDGKELFDFTLDGKLEVVEVKGGAMPQAACRRSSFRLPRG
jgi:hypothetical protein